MPVGPQESVLYPLGSRVLTVGVLAIALVVAGSLVGWGRWEVLLRAAPGIALVAAGTIVLFWLPRVRVSPTGIEVVNPFRTYRAGWEAVQEVGTRWSTTLYTESGRIEVWAAPASGPLTGARDRARTGTAAIVRRQWEAYRDAPPLGSTGNGLSRHGHPLRVALLVTLAALTLLSILLP
ncbi:MAG: PH domain-containing protein [Micrococcales bacterium]|nr:PH domain-containing protein [Micrococcales bacterium]